MESAADFFGSLTPLSSDDFAGIPCEDVLHIPAGSIHRIAGEEWIVLESFLNNTTAVLHKDLLESKRFGEDCDWRRSQIRNWLNSEYYPRIANDIGEENIIPIQRNLISLDGLDDLCDPVCTDKISLLTVDEYRRYHRVIGLRRNYPDWWWLCTPFTTPDGGYSRYVCCVGSGGCVGWGGVDDSYGVRPFFVLNSSVLTS